MSDSILVRVTLDAYDFAHPSRKQTQVYVQIPEVARAVWLLPEDHFGFSKSEPWPSVVDSAQEHYVQRGMVTDSASEAARLAVVKWLSDDANHDAMQEAWELNEARRHPVARKLLARVTELEQCQKNQADNFEAQAALIRQAEARVAELETLTASATEFRVWEPGYGLYVRRAPGTTGFAVMEARRTDKGRRVWTTAGWQYSELLSDAEMFCWPDAQTAVAEARRIMPGAVADEGLSGPCDCGEGAVHYTTADCPAARRDAETGGAE
jgi:hypothetical protein